jgi:hypothetical protein
VVEPDVLIHDEPHTRRRAPLHDAAGVGIRSRQGLLREDPADLAGPGQGGLDHRRLDVGGDGDVEHLDLRVVEQPIERGMHPRDPVPGGHLGRGLGPAGRDRQRTNAGL